MAQMDARLDVLKKIGEAYTRHTEELALAGARDAGFPVSIGRLEVKLAADHLATMREEAYMVEGREPYGVVAAILPYDAPSVMVARFGGAAMLGGNVFRASFSSQTPATARLMADILAGTEGLELMVGADNREFGRASIDDPGVRAFFVSGAGAVGEVYRSAIDSFHKIIFAGPGGMPAGLILEDADLDYALDFLTKRAFLNGGQYCTTIKKVVVVAEHFKKTRDAFLEYALSLKVGDPLDPETDIGPIKVGRTRQVMEYCLGEIRGEVLTGSIEGEWVTPFVVEALGVPDIEGFGPLVVLVEAADRRDAFRHVLGTSYGFLIAGFGGFSDGEKKSLEETFGMVHINPDFLFTPLRLPFGGRGKSGWVLTRTAEGVTSKDGALMYAEELVR